MPKDTTKTSMLFRVDRAFRELVRAICKARGYTQSGYFRTLVLADMQAQIQRQSDGLLMQETLDNMKRLPL